MNGPNGGQLFNGGPTGSLPRSAGQRLVLLPGSGANPSEWTYEATADVTSLTISLPARFQQARKLWLEYDIVLAGAISTLSVRPNGSAADGTGTAQIQFAGGTSNGTGAGTVLAILSPNEAASVQGSGDIEFWLKAGARRRYVARGVSFTSTTPRTERQHHYEGFWNDSSTVITSIELFSDAGSGIRAGSRVALWGALD